MVQAPSPAAHGTLDGRLRSWSTAAPGPRLWHRLAALLTARGGAGSPRDDHYRFLLGTSGGKFTDALEREAENRMRASWWSD